MPAITFPEPTARQYLDYALAAREKGLTKADIQAAQLEDYEIIAQWVDLRALAGGETVTLERGRGIVAELLEQIRFRTLAMTYVLNDRALDQLVTAVEREEAEVGEKGAASK